jgi:hypothetical protein
VPAFGYSARSPAGPLAGPPRTRAKGRSADIALAHRDRIDGERRDPMRFNRAMKRAAIAAGRLTPRPDMSNRRVFARVSLRETESELTSASKVVRATDYAVQPPSLWGGAGVGSSPHQPRFFANNNVAIAEPKTSRSHAPWSDGAVNGDGSSPHAFKRGIYPSRQFVDRNNRQAFRSHFGRPPPAWPRLMAR